MFQRITAPSSWRVKIQVLQSFETRALLVQWQSITSQVTWVIRLVLAWCQDFHFSQLQFPFHSYLKVRLYYCGTTVQLPHTATTQTQLAGCAATADGSRSHRKQHIQNTVCNKATSWCPLHRLQVPISYDVHHSHNNHLTLCKTYCFSADCAYTQPVRQDTVRVVLLIILIFWFVTWHWVSEVWWYLHTHALGSPRITVACRRQVKIHRLVQARIDRWRYIG